MAAGVVETTRIDPAAAARAKRLRVVTWAALPVMAVIYVVLWRSPLPAFSRLIALEIIYVTPIVLTVALGLRAAAESEGRERLFWRALSLALSILFACEVLLVYWVGVIDPAGPPRISWPFHLMHGIAAVSFIVACGSLSRFSEAPQATRIRWTADMSSLALFAGVLLLEFYVRPVMEPAGATVPEMLLGVGYPLFGLVMIFTTLANLVGFKVERWRAWDKLVAVSLAVYAIAIFVWPLWFPTAVTTSRNYERGVLDLVQFSGHWLLMSAAVYRLTEVRQWRLRPLPPLDAARYRWASAVTPAFMLVGLGVLASFAWRAMENPDWLPVYFAAFVVVTALALFRGALIALENGVLFHRSVTDPLTGLHNRRYIFERLAEELERARRYGDELSVISIDVDSFGELNAQIGHAAGDRLLREVGALIRSRCTSDCVVARIGLDDFLLIAPRTGPMEASVIARRLIDAVSIGAGTEPGTVTISAGVASFPTDADSREELVKVSRGALYHAKQSGTENVVAYEGERVLDLSPQDRIERLERQNRLSSIRALRAAVDAHDAEIHEHGGNVAVLAVHVAQALQLSPDRIERVETAALLHDIGKIGNAEGPARRANIAGSEEERISAEHGALGQQILAASGLTDLLPIIRNRHEWWDGSGYPNGLKGEEIPVEARILALCDAYDAMISDRPFRPALSRRQARSEIEARSGNQFDPTIVQALIEVLDEGVPFARAGVVS